MSFRLDDEPNWAPGPSQGLVIGLTPTGPDLKRQLGPSSGPGRIYANLIPASKTYFSNFNFLTVPIMVFEGAESIGINFI